MKIKAEVLPETNGSITIAVDTLELVVNAPTKEEAEAELLSELKIYAEDYMDRLDIFAAAPNRAAHLPIVKAISEAGPDELKKMIIYRCGTSQCANGPKVSHE